MNGLMIHRKANEFLVMFTNIYKDEIMEWKGDLSVFKPAYNLLRTSAKSKKKLKLIYNKKEKDKKLYFFK